MHSSIKNVFCLAIVIFMLTSCGGEKPIGPNEVDKITLEIIDRTELPEGISYTIKLANHSKHLIKQNNVYLSYPIKTESGTKGNVFKVEAQNNKLDLKPDEEIMLQAFTPIEEYKDNEKIVTTQCYLEIKGYIEEVKEINHFGKTIGMHF